MGPELDIAPVATARVPFMALERQHGAMGRELTAAFERVVRQSAFILGEEVERFEQEFAAACGVARASASPRARPRLTLALIAAGIGPGDEVIVPAHTYIASALAVLHAGRHPVFCDVEDGTGLHRRELGRRGGQRTRTAAILPVHLYGQACDMDALRAARAPPRPARRRGRRPGARRGVTRPPRRARSGAAAAFSFYPSKNLGALGDGGAICTDDPEIARRRGGSATSASGARASTSSRASTSGSTGSRPPSCG